MNIEIINETHQYTIYYSELEIEINGKTIIMDISVCGSVVERCN